MLFCSKCGAKNSAGNEKCEKCGEFLTKRPEIKSYDDFEKIFTEENFRALDELTSEGYQTVLENIENMGHSHLRKNISPKNTDILDKIRRLSESYSEIKYKSVGAELGSYSFNSIRIDDRLDRAKQISTLIHELSHHIFSEIFEQILMYLWQCEKSDAIEALAWFTLIGSPLTRLSNEYCAHSCEGRFVPHGYQNYGSFNQIIIEEFDEEKDRTAIGVGLVFGNSMARDILGILEKFIDYNLREEIMEQFKRDFTYPPQYDQIILETNEYMSEEAKLENIRVILKSGFEAAKDKEMHEVLDEFKKKFEETNRDLNIFF